jgi:hypothetical protein
LTFYFRVIGATYQEHKAYEGTAFEEMTQPSKREL